MDIRGRPAVLFFFKGNRGGVDLKRGDVGAGTGRSECHCVQSLFTHGEGIFVAGQQVFRDEFAECS